MIKLIRQNRVGEEERNEFGLCWGNREGGWGIFIAFDFSRDSSGLWEADDILAGKLVLGFTVYTKLDNFASFRCC